MIKAKITNKNPEGKLLMDFISKHGLIRCSAIEKLVRAPQGSIRKSRPIPKRYCKAVRLILEKKYGLEKDVIYRQTAKSVAIS